ncbi:MAG: hypothetical protein CTY12_02590 [Methylotenera sp.]|nr:MAG: hypothetical protein CTY12_02590 [Methylotenera sp.]
MKKSLLRIFLGLIVGGIFLYFAQRQIELKDVGNLLSTSNVYFVVALCVSLSVVQLLRSERWLRTFTRVLELKRCPIYRAFLLGNAANSFLPGRAGDLIRATIIKQEHVDIGFGQAVGTVAVEKVADLFVILLLLLILIVTTPLPDWVKNSAITGGLLLLSVIPILIVTRWVQLSLLQRAKSKNIIALDTIFHRIGRMLKGFIEAFYILTHGNGVGWIFMLSLLIWSLEIISVFLGCHALGLDISFAAGVLTVVMLSFGTMLPAAPGFVGTYQWLTVASLGIFGIGETSAFTTGVLLNLAVILVNVFTGIAAMLFMHCGQSSQRLPK